MPVRLHDHRTIFESLQQICSLILLLRTTVPTNVQMSDEVLKHNTGKCKNIHSKLESVAVIDTEHFSVTGSLNTYCLHFFIIIV